MQNEPRVLYRARRYFRHKYCTWYEQCPVMKITSKYITVDSGDFPGSPLYKGGRFQVNRGQIEETGKAYHSRHGEYFHLEKPELGDLFPSKDLIEMPDAVTAEAQQIGWDTSIPLWEWNEWQKDCYLYATLASTTLRQAIDLWKSGKLEEAWREWRGKRFKLDL